MNSSSRDILGLEAIRAELAKRYEFDDAGRIARSRSDGVLPRFVLGRAVEGCVWRFCVGLDPDLIVAISRLAAREPGRVLGGEMPSPPPERLVMIERHLSVVDELDSTSHELLLADGRTCAELWTIS